jgi:hypothetical protein
MRQAGSALSLTLGRRGILALVVEAAGDAITLDAWSWRPDQNVSVVFR